MKLSTMKVAVSTALMAGLLVSAIPLLHADETTVKEHRAQWRKNHPARAKDNARIRNQKRLLNQDLKSGKITKDQYNAQMKDLNTVKREENVDARANENGGHLSGGQQQAINGQLNDSRKDINQDVKSDQVQH